MATDKEILTMIKEASERGYPYYVYELSDPDESPFYVGKGKNKRIFDHLKNSLSGKEHNLKKEKRIRENDYIVHHQIVCFCKDEEQAFQIEQQFIHIRGIENLTNTVERLSRPERDILWAKNWLERVMPLNEWLQTPTFRFMGKEIPKISEDYKRIHGEISAIAQGKPVIRQVVAYQNSL